MVIPYREEMAKRHLKVTGDLGKVVFVVCFPMTPTGEYATEAASVLGIRPAKYRVYRGERQAL